MKKLLIALALGLVLVLALATVASADNGPHGRFNGSTQACASCHRAHSAVSSSDMLLTYDTIWALCTSCHDGSGAYTNVVDGYYDTDTVQDTDFGARNLTTDPTQGGKTDWSDKTGQAGMGLFGGGFVHARMLTDYGTTATQTCSTNRFEPDCVTLATSPLGGNTTAYWTGSALNQYNDSAEAWAVKNKYDSTLGLPTGRNVTSAHKVGQQAAGLLTAEFTADATTESGTVWGGGTYRTVAGGYANTPAGAAASAAAEGNLVLECTSCHTPHGAGGKVGGLDTGVPTPSYRLLEFSPENGAEVYELDPIVTVNYTNVSGVVGNNYTLARLYWDQPSVLGVTVPDVTSYWYTPNTDATYDTAARSYRNSDGYYVANMAGPGDYGGIYFAYMRPATASGMVCPDTDTSDASSTNLPGAAPAYACSGVTAAATAAGYTNFNNLPAQNVMGFWCATCHDRYLAPGGGGLTIDTVLTGNPNAADLQWLVSQQADGVVSTGGSRTTDSGDVAYHYRHRSQGVLGQVSTAASLPATFSSTGPEGAATLPAGVIGWKQGISSSSTNNTYPTSTQYTCLSCHNAHGTVAQATQFSQDASYSNSSALLKADNRAICLRCHANSVNFFNTVTTPNVIWVAP